MRKFIAASILAAFITVPLAITFTSEEDELMWNCSLMGNRDCPLSTEYNFGWINLTD